MKKRIKVSIIVPVYNTLRYLDRCLNSLVNQTLKEIEIIVVDDGSSEDIKSIVNNYKDVKYIKNKHKGIGYTRNTGLRLSKGDYVGFVDSDDFVEPNMFENYFVFASENKLDIVVGNYYKIKDKIRYVQNIPYFKIGNINSNKDILTKIDFGPCNKIFKNSIIKSKNILFDEELKYEDLPFVSKALFYSKRIGHINKPYYNYEVRNFSETTSFSTRNFDIFKVLTLFINLFKKKNPIETEYVVVSKLLDYNIQQRNNKDKKMKNEFIEKSFEYIYYYFPYNKKNKYLKKEPYKKRVIKNNKTITKLYCYLYSKLKKM